MYQDQNSEYTTYILKRTTDLPSLEIQVYNENEQHHTFRLLDIQQKINNNNQTRGK